MNYMYIPGFSNYPIADVDNLLNTYEHIGKEKNAQTLTFIGRINGFLHSIELKQFDIINNKEEKTIYLPKVTKLKTGKPIEVVTTVC